MQVPVPVILTENYSDIGAYGEGGVSTGFLGYHFAVYCLVVDSYCLIFAEREQARPKVKFRRGGRQSPLRNKEITKLLSQLIIYGTDVLTAANRANVNVSSDRHLWHDFVRGLNLYMDKVTKVFIDFERISR